MVMKTRISIICVTQVEICFIPITPSGLLKYYPSLFTSTEVLRPFFS